MTETPVNANMTFTDIFVLEVQPYIIRFKFNGWHFTSRDVTLIGMAMIFDVDGDSVKNIPKGFPICGDFVMKPKVR